MAFPADPDSLRIARELLCQGRFSEAIGHYINGIGIPDNYLPNCCVRTYTPSCKDEESAIVELSAMFHLAAYDLEMEHGPGHPGVIEMMEMGFALNKTLSFRAGPSGQTVLNFRLGGVLCRAAEAYFGRGMNEVSKAGLTGNAQRDFILGFTHAVLAVRRGKPNRNELISLREHAHDPLLLWPSNATDSASFVRSPYARQTYDSLVAEGEFLDGHGPDDSVEFRRDVNAALFKGNYRLFDTGTGRLVDARGRFLARRAKAKVPR